MLQRPPHRHCTPPRVPRWVSTNRFSRQRQAEQHTQRRPTVSTPSDPHLIYDREPPSGHSQTKGCARSCRSVVQRPLRNCYCFLSMWCVLLYQLPKSVKTYMVGFNSPLSRMFQVCSRCRYGCRTELTEVSGTGIDFVPNLPNEVHRTGTGGTSIHVVPNLPKYPVYKC